MKKIVFGVCFVPVDHRAPSPVMDYFWHPSPPKTMYTPGYRFRWDTK